MENEKVNVLSLTDYRDEEYVQLNFDLDNNGELHLNIGEYDMYLDKYQVKLLQTFIDIENKKLEV